LGASKPLASTGEFAMQQKNQQQPKNQAPGQQAGQHEQGNQPRSNPNRNEEFPGKAPEVYSDRGRARNPDEARDPKRQQDDRHHDRRRNA
jgi:hypothetical protein